MPCRSAFPPLVALAAAAAVAGCQPPQQPVREAVAPGEATSLWRIEALQNGEAVSQLDICADRTIQDSFIRPAPEVEGRPCVRVSEPVETGDAYAVRCRVDDQLYRVGSVVQGDRERDFTVDMAVTRHDARGPMFEQVRRYRLLGSCPAGWAIGDSAQPGAPTIVNTLSGASRTGPPHTPPA